MHAGRNTLCRRRKIVLLLAIQCFNLTAATILTFPYLTSPCLPPVSLEWPVDSKWNVSEKKEVEQLLEVERSRGPKQLINVLLVSRQLKVKPVDIPPSSLNIVLRDEWNIETIPVTCCFWRCKAAGKKKKEQKLGFHLPLMDCHSLSGTNVHHSGSWVFITVNQNE